jgi:glycosyltransferase involved in cell wall biosynthesis
MRLAYIVSRFPSTTETFIAREMRAVEQFGAPIELFALIREHDVVVHPEAEPFLARFRTAPLTQPATLSAQWYWLRRRPGVYLGTLLWVLWSNVRSPRFLLRALVVFPMAARFAREAEELGIEHVHAHWATHPALAALVVQRLTQIPFSFTAHAHDIFVNRTMLRPKIDAASFVAVISNYNRDYLVSLYGDRIQDKLVVVRCGVDPERFAPRRPSGPAGRAALRIVCVASLQRYKGHTVLLDALALVRDRGVSIECALIGDGVERPVVEQRIRALDLQRVVALLGAQTSDEVLSHVRDADVMVLPSVVARDGQMEGIPVALIEALSCEVPVIASRLSGIPELVIDGETGMLVRPGDADALARAIERVARDANLRKRFGAAGRALVMREFDTMTNAKRLVAAIERADQRR